MKKVLLVLSVLSFMNTSNALDFGKYISSVLSDRAGSKAVGEADEKDISQYAENKCWKINPWGFTVPIVKSEKDTNSVFFCREVYNVRYDTKMKIPLFVASVLFARDLTRYPPKKIVFGGNKLDPDLPKNMQVNLDDYKGTGYVPLNVLPVSDSYYYAPGLSEEGLLPLNQTRVDEAYYLSNTLPIATGLKRTWEQLEIQTRANFKDQQMQQVFVITGPIFLNGQNKGRIGKNGPIIPTHIFKIIANPQVNGTVSYILPNDNSCAAGCDLRSFIAPIREVERLTGLNTFSGAAPQYSAKIKMDPTEYDRKQ
jgi:DNA/RNA endonuclease G (NUC1)